MRTTDQLVTQVPVRRRRRRWLGRLLLLAVVAVAVAGGWLGARSLFAAAQPPQCQASASGLTFTLEPDQAANAALIAGVAERRELPPRAVTIALAAALQESKLRNLEFGDRDSLGLFQQRPSQGWGTAAQILDPVYATNRFFDALVKVRGYASMDITDVAQKVQRSGYPEAYAEHEALARVFASALTGHSPGALGCRLADATRAQAAAGLAGLAKDLDAQTGITIRPTSDGAPAASGATGKGPVTATLTVPAADSRQSWALASWVVARASLYGVTAVRVGSKEWRRDQSDDGLVWHVGSAEPVPDGQVLVVIDTG